MTVAVTPAVTTRTRLWWGLHEVPSGWGPCVVTLGVFDGVHRGRARLVRRAVDRGRELGVATVVVTFDPHPARVVGPPRDTAALSTPRRRAGLAGDLGVDAVLVLPFTPEPAATPLAEFAGRVRMHGLRACAAVVGTDFRFGARGAGTVDVLHDLCRRHGFTVEGVDLLRTADVRCSSSHVRACLSTGDVTAAAALAGTAAPAPGRYDGVLTVDGRPSRPVAVRVDADRSVHPAGPLPDVRATAAVDFLS